MSNNRVQNGTPIATSFLGVVILLDALGVSQYSVEECAQFLTKRKRILDSLLPSLFESTYWIIKQKNDGTSSVNSKTDHLEFRQFTFGDSILLVANGNTIGINLISILSKLTNDWIVQGLLEGVLFRGAVSIGEIVFDNNNTFIGPAIAEVARAYEQPQLPGIVFTPSLSIMLDKAKLVQEIWEKDNYFIDKHLIKLDLPAKNQKGEEVNLSNTWFTRWPRTMEDWILQKPEFPYRSTRIFMKQLLNKTDTYQQAPSKARNTMTFIETALEEQFDSKTKSLTAI